ncbi:hypothetical protein [Streptomyces sp. NBC_00079]|uniref:hypothetical protein n=1 Tax=Streptomyces sp. NBC_00079 TaxID=2975644 RepID=UPI003246076E
MTLVAVCSVKGSPGVTTAALGLAGCWPFGHRPLMVECDPGGGDLLARYRLDMAPGLVSLAAAARRTTEPDLVWQHTQRLPGGLPVVTGPPGAEQARAAIEQLTMDSTTLLRKAADRAGAVVVADCGRIDPQSPVMPVLHQADATILIARAKDDALAHVATRAGTLERWSRRMCFVLVGDGYRSDEVARELGITVTARLPEDPRGAAALRGDFGRRSSPARSALGKALAALARQVADLAAEVPRRELTEAELAAPAAHFGLPAGPHAGGPPPHGNGAV